MLLVKSLAKNKEDSERLLKSLELYIQDKLEQARLILHSSGAKN